MVDRVLATDKALDLIEKLKPHLPEVRQARRPPKRKQMCSEVDRGHS